MSDVDIVAGNEPGSQEEDPAAAFLAREKDEFAELGDDTFGPAETAVNNQPDDMFGDGAAAETINTSNINNTNIWMMGGGDVDAVASDQDFDPFGGGSPTPDTVPDTVPDVGAFGADTFGANTNEPSAPSDQYSAIKSEDHQINEPEKIRIWREEQIVRLAKKDKESDLKADEWRAAASKELEDWYKHRADQLEKTKANNRESEAAFVQDRDESIPGHEFEKVCRLCEFNPKVNRSTKDVSRMRSILLQLKQTPIQRS